MADEVTVEDEKVVAMEEEEGVEEVTEEAVEDDPALPAAAEGMCSCCSSARGWSPTATAAAASSASTFPFSSGDSRPLSSALRSDSVRARRPRLVPPATLV